MMDALSNTVAVLAAFFLYASLKTTIIIGLVLLAQKLFGRFLSANGRYLLWLPVVVGLVTPVGFNVVLPAGFFRSETAMITAAPVASIQNAAPMIATGIPAVDLKDVGAAQLFTADALPVAAPFPWLSALICLWITGVVTVLAMIALASHRFAALVQQATPVSEELQTRLDNCVRETACRVSVKALHSPQIQTPMVTGLCKPVLLLPEDITARLTEQQLRHVIIHELMHLNRLDIVSNWVGALLQALHWFNPVVWLAFSLMRHDRELACDAATVAHLAPADRVAYGHTLLQLSETLPRATLPATALGILDNPSHLRRRILMLVQTSRPRTPQTFAMTVLVTLLSAVAFSQPAPQAPARPVVAAPMPAPAAPKSPEVMAAAETPAARSVTPAPATPVAREVREARPVTPAPAPAPAPLPAPAVTPTPAAVPPAPPAAPPRAEATFNATAPALAQSLLQPATSATEPAFQPATDTLPLIAAADIAESPAAAPAVAVDAGEVQQFADDINAIKADRIRYVNEWNGTAAECEARREKLFGGASKPCRQTVMALARGEIFNFTYECHQLSSRHDELLTALATNEPSSATRDMERTLADSALELAAFCSKETYRNEYPAFAALYAEAESLEHYDPRTERRSYPYLHYEDSSRREFPVQDNFPQGMTDYGQNGNFGSFIALPAAP